MIGRQLGFAAVLDEVDFLSHPPTPWNTVDARSRLGAGYHNWVCSPVLRASWFE